MKTKEILRKTSSAALFFLSLISLLGGYLASYTAKDSLLSAGGIAIGLVLIASAAHLGNVE